MVLSPTIHSVKYAVVGKLIHDLAVHLVVVQPLMIIILKDVVVEGLFQQVAVHFVVVADFTVQVLTYAVVVY